MSRRRTALGGDNAAANHSRAEHRQYPRRVIRVATAQLAGGFPSPSVRGHVAIKIE